MSDDSPSEPQERRPANETIAVDCRVWPPEIIRNGKSTIPQAWSGETYSFPGPERPLIPNIALGTNTATNGRPSGKDRHFERPDIRVRPKSSSSLAESTEHHPD